MKKTLIVLLYIFFSHYSEAQEADSLSQPNVTVKWAPAGLVFGNISLQAEYNFGGRSSLTAKIGLPVSAKHSFSYEDEQADFNMKATSFLAGYRTYFGKKHLRGLYYEPFFKYVHHASEGIGTGTLDQRPATYSLMNTYSGFGVGVQLGAQFLIGKRFVIDLFFLGPEINSSSNSFKATEISNTLPWTNVDAGKAEDDIRDFLNQFPFVRNRTNVMVDRESKTVIATFKGALPGIRTGVSFGFAF